MKMMMMTTTSTCFPLFCVRLSELCAFRCHKEPLCSSSMCLSWHLNQKNYWLLRDFVTMATPPPSLDFLFMVVNRGGGGGTDFRGKQSFKSFTVFLWIDVIFPLRPEHFCFNPVCCISKNFETLSLSFIIEDLTQKQSVSLLALLAKTLRVI